MELFAQATRKKLRFASPKGDLTVEQLWDLPLKTGGTLDEVAKALDKQRKESAETGSFVSDTPKKDDSLEIKFGVVMEIITVKKNEKAQADLKASNAEKLRKLQELKERKQNEKLDGLTEAEIDEQIAILS
jgi:hypothetical protein